MVAAAMGRGEGVRGARGVGGLVACERARACALCVGVGLCMCANARAHVHVSMCVRKQRMQGQRGGREGKGRGEHLSLLAITFRYFAQARSPCWCPRIYHDTRSSLVGRTSCTSTPSSSFSHPVLSFRCPPPCPARAHRASSLIVVRFPCSYLSKPQCGSASRRVGVYDKACIE